MHCMHVYVTKTLTLVSLPPLATSGSEVHMPRANAAVSVCPTNSKSGVLAVLSCRCQVKLTALALTTAGEACTLPHCVCLKQITKHFLLHTAVCIRDFCRSPTEADLKKLNDGKADLHEAAMGVYLVTLPVRLSLCAPGKELWGISVCHNH